MLKNFVKRVTYIFCAMNCHVPVRSDICFYIIECMCKKKKLSRLFKKLTPFLVRVAGRKKRKTFKWLHGHNYFYRKEWKRTFSACKVLRQFCLCPPQVSITGSPVFYLSDLDGLDGQWLISCLQTRDTSKEENFNTSKFRLLPVWTRSDWRTHKQQYIIENI